MNFKSSVKEIVKRFTPTFVKQVGVYQYTDDLNPLLTNYLTRNSVTCHTASNLMTQFVSGYGIKEFNDIKVNDKQTLYNLITDIARSIVDNRGVYIHRNLNLNGKTTTLKVIPFDTARVGKKDDNNYNAKILVKKDWEDRKEKPQVFDVWNDDKKVIQAQFDAQGEGYKGQVLFINFDSHLIYPLPRLMPVINDAYTEIQAGEYKKSLMDNGFLSKFWVTTPPFTDSLVNGVETPAEQLRKNFVDDFEKLLGVKNAGKILHTEAEFDGVDDLDKNIVIKEIKQNVDDKAFSHTEESAKSNIIMAYNNAPKILVTNVETGVFGNSGELIKQAKLFYQESTERERMELENILTFIFSKWHQPEYRIKMEIDTLINIDDKAISDSGSSQNVAVDENAKAQAQLRGSVGGVQGILQIQQSYAQGLTSLTSALAILEEIYGFSEEVARELLGNPEKITDNETNSI